MADVARTLSLGDEAYVSLRRMIIGGTIPGRTVIREADLARQLEMSRTPLREAMRRLQAEGLLSIVPNRGYIVTPITRQDIVNIYEVRRVLEGLAGRLAAERRTRVDLALLADTLDGMKAAVAHENDAELAALNSQFHDGMASASHNDYLQTMLSNIRETFERYRSSALTHPGRRQDAHVEHSALYEALCASDCDLAERLAKEHVKRALTVRLHDTDPSREESAPEQS